MSSISSATSPWGVWRWDPSISASRLRSLKLGRIVCLSFSKLSLSANSVCYLTPLDLLVHLHAHTVLVGDTSSSTLLSAYPQIAQQFPNQIACIFIRNTSATDSDDKIPYSTKEFQSLDKNRYFFYTTAEGQSTIHISVLSGWHWVPYFSQTW